VLVVPLEITLTGNYIVAFLAFVREERDAVANPTARAFPTDSHQLESSFPYAARRFGCASCRRRRRDASHCYTFSTEQDKFFLLCFTGIRFALFSMETHRMVEQVNFVRRILRFSLSPTSFLGKQRMVVSKGDQQTLGVYFLEHAIEAI